MPDGGGCLDDANGAGHAWGFARAGYAHWQPDAHPTASGNRAVGDHVGARSTGSSELAARGIYGGGFASHRTVDSVLESRAGDTQLVVAASAICFPGLARSSEASGDLVTGEPHHGEST
jgi:hypothetical protein